MIMPKEDPINPKKPKNVVNYAVWQSACKQYQPSSANESNESDSVSLFEQVLFPSQK